MPGVCKLGKIHENDWIEVNQDDVRDLITDARAWRQNNPDATTEDMKKALKQALVNRWPAVVDKPRYWVFLGLLDSGRPWWTRGEARWLVRNFWDVIPPERRIGAKP